MTKDQQKAMSNRIKKRREALCFTQEGFSEKIGLSISSYSKIENAFQKPALDTLIKIAQRLEVTLDYLVFGSEEQLGELIDVDKIKAILKNADKNKLAYAAGIFSKIAKLME